METPVIHRSKKDTWLVSVVASAGLALGGAAAYQLLAHGIGHPPTWILLLAFLFYSAVVLIFAYPVSYEITPRDLLIRSGLTRSRIMLSSIETVQPTRSPISSPALSLDRLQIGYREKGKLTSTLISPENKDAFLNDLAQRAEGLQRRGDKITGTTEPAGI